MQRLKGCQMSTKGRLPGIEFPGFTRCIFTEFAQRRRWWSDRVGEFICILETRLKWMVVHQATRYSVRDLLVFRS